MTDIKDLIAKINALPDDAVLNLADDSWSFLDPSDLKVLVQRLEQAEGVIEHYAAQKPRPGYVGQASGKGPDKARAYLSEGEKK